MPTLNLTDEEAQQVMNALIQSNPLLMKIANQLREQAGPAPGPAPGPPEGIVVKPKADGKEARHE